MVFGEESRLVGESRSFLSSRPNGKIPKMKEKTYPVMYDRVSNQLFRTESHQYLLPRNRNQDLNRGVRLTSQASIGEKVAESHLDGILEVMFIDVEVEGEGEVGALL